MGLDIEFIEGPLPLSVARDVRFCKVYRVSELITPGRTQAKYQGDEDSKSIEDYDPKAEAIRIAETPSFANEAYEIAFDKLRFQVKKDNSHERNFITIVGDISIIKEFPTVEKKFDKQIGDLYFPQRGIILQGIGYMPKRNP